MKEESRQARLRDAGFNAWRMTVVGGATLLVLILYVGMAYLVYLDRMEAGPIILFTGVILGYLLRSLRDWV